VTLIGLEGGEQFLLQPVHAGMCTYLDLKNGSLSLYDVALLNEYLEMEAENRARLEAARPTRS